MAAPAITDYERRTTHSRNPLARFSHRARQRQALALIWRYLPESGSMLDFGCAGGELLRQIRGGFPLAQLYGLDPFSLPGQGYAHLRAPAECGNLSFDVITAFEVLEHLNESATEEFFALAGKHLAPGGTCIVSAPNMLGPALLPKLLHGFLTGGSALNYAAGEALRAALLAQNPPRLTPGRTGTMRHKGYDWRQTRGRIARGFDIVSETFTPVNALWWGFNSQWFCAFRPRHALETT